MFAVLIISFVTSHNIKFCYQTITIHSPTAIEHMYFLSILINKEKVTVMYVRTEYLIFMTIRTNQAGCFFFQIYLCLQGNKSK